MSLGYLGASFSLDAQFCLQICLVPFLKVHVLGQLGSEHLSQLQVLSFFPMSLRTTPRLSACLRSPVILSVSLASDDRGMARMVWQLCQFKIQILILIRKYINPKSWLTVKVGAARLAQSLTKFRSFSILKQPLMLKVLGPIRILKGTPTPRSLSPHPPIT